MAQAGETRPLVRAKLWDLPTRIFHWTLAAAILAAWLTAGKQMDWHRWLGYTVLGLLVFRIYWGFVGSGSARFSSFVKGPKATLAYAGTLANRDSDPSAGHNPIGAISVVALLVLILVQAGLGLFAVDIDGIESGPLSHLVDFDTGRLASKLHELTFRILQALVVLHIAAVGFYLVYKRQNLAGAMITGWGKFRAAPQVPFAPAWLAVVGIVLGAAVAYAVSKGFKF
jgi:cytochrome b